MKKELTVNLDEFLSKIIFNTLDNEQVFEYVNFILEKGIPAYDLYSRLKEYYLGVRDCIKEFDIKFEGMKFGRFIPTMDTCSYLFFENDKLKITIETYETDSMWEEKANANLFEKEP